MCKGGSFLSVYRARVSDLTVAVQEVKLKVRVYMGVVYIHADMQKGWADIYI